MSQGASLPPAGPGSHAAPPYGSGPGGAPIPTPGSPVQTATPPQYDQPTTEFAGAPNDPNAAYAGQDSQRYSIPFDQRPAARPRRRLGSIAPLVLLVFLVIILGLVAMCGGSGHKSTGGNTGPTGNHSPGLTTARPTGAPPPPATPTEMTIPSTSAGRACFPLQPNC
ncbi:hypothetical protein [Nocardia sp. BMG111209]|uniref:hypothetical protein n=1 Tax=Nocardia sp. BMG111209 TaxID=1160137 RepID=UPI0009DC48F1